MNNCNYEIPLFQTPPVGEYSPTCPRKCMSWGSTDPVTPHKSMELDDWCVLCLMGGGGGQCPTTEHILIVTNGDTQISFIRMVILTFSKIFWNNILPLAKCFQIYICGKYSGKYSETFFNCFQIWKIFRNIQISLTNWQVTAVKC